MEKRVKIGKSIIKEINKSNIPDTALAESMGISRYAIHKWKTGKSESMREINLISLAEVLKLQVTYSEDGFAELEPQNPIIDKKGLDMTNSIGEVLVKTIDNLWLQLEERDETIKELEATIKELQPITQESDNTN
jgi:transcriptional regulator with XRE-family HTH domain